jgi:MFS family permease
VSASPHLRHNALALGADFALFLAGMSFASASTVLPAFAAWLGASNVVIGAIPAVMTLGWFLPSLFLAAYTESLPRKLPFVLRWTVWERVPFLVLALSAFFVAGRAPALALALMLAMLAITTGVGGALMPAWMDIIGRAVPVTLRGRFFAATSLGATAAGFAGSFLTAHLLATVAAPASYGLCFLCAAACMAVSYVALALVREPDAETASEPLGIRAHLGRVPALLRADRNLSWFLGARAFALLGTMSAGFFTVYALRAWNPPTAEVGAFTALMLAGQMAGTVTLGWLADRAGHRLVIMTGIAAVLAGNLVALGTTSLPTFAVVFVLAGLQQAAVTVSNLNVMLEFAPAAAERPTYVGLGTTSMAPVAFAAPLVGGMLADARGFGPVFLVSALASAAALVLLAALVRDPRHVRSLQAVGEP